MAYIVVDMEADGPIPGVYSMVCCGALPTPTVDVHEYHTVNDESSPFRVQECGPVAAEVLPSSQWGQTRMTRKAESQRCLYWQHRE